MNNKLKISLILVAVFILFLAILLAIPPIENYILDQKTLKYQEYEKIGDAFIYEFQYDETYDNLCVIVERYNNHFDYKTENKIIMGKNEKETVFAEYDENSITIYCEAIMNGKLTDNQIEEYLECLIDLVVPENMNRARAFINELSNSHSGIASIIFSIIFVNNTGYIPSTLRLFIDIISIVNIILCIFAYCYLIYSPIYLLYCKIKKKEIKNIKRQVLLCLLSVLYLLIGGLSGLISFIFSLTY